jgi:hypothetical protein
MGDVEAACLTTHHDLQFLPQDKVAEFARMDPQVGCAMCGVCCSWDSAAAFQRQTYI